jgi:hypothetical protein
VTGRLAAEVRQSLATLSAALDTAAAAGVTDLGCCHATPYLYRVMWYAGLAVKAMPRTLEEYEAAARKIKAHEAEADREIEAQLREDREAAP